MGWFSYKMVNKLNNYFYIFDFEYPVLPKLSPQQGTSMLQVNQLGHNCLVLVFINFLMYKS